MTRYVKPSDNRILDPVFRDRYIYNRGGIAYGVYNSKRFSLEMVFDIKKKQQLLNEFNTRIRLQETKRHINAAISQDGSLYGAFKEFFDVYVRDLSRATRSHYKRIVKVYFPDDMDLNNPELIKIVVIDKITNSNYAKNTKWKHVQRINKFLDYCVSQRKIEYNPIPKELAPVYEHKKVEYFTDAEFAAIKNYFRENNYEMYLLIVFVEMTACRIDEAIKLTWDAINEKEIQITGKTNRKFPIRPFPNLPKLLNEIKKINPVGKLFSWKWEAKPQKHLRNVKLKLNIDNKYSFHAIRKMTIDKWKDAGINVEIRSRLAGHSVAVQSKNYNKEPDWQYFEKLLEGFEIKN